MSNTKRHGGTVGSVVGLLALLVTVAIMIYLFSLLADTYTLAGKRSEESLQDSLKKTQDWAKEVQESLDRRSEGLEQRLGLEAPSGGPGPGPSSAPASAPTTEPAGRP